MERLQKIIARAGIASRRHAEKIILDGRVRVNGQLICELGSKADPHHDHIKVDGKLIRPQQFEYHLLYKPRGVLSAVTDDKGRAVVTDLVQSRVRLYPVGRLDFDSEGLILLTNDGELARILTEAGKVEKRYEVKVRGAPSSGKIERLRKGLRVQGEKFAQCGIKLIKQGNNCWFEVILKQGRNRQIRRMFEQVGHPVMKLRRVSIGHLIVGRLRSGRSRVLTSSEVVRMKRIKA